MQTLILVSCPNSSSPSASASSKKPFSPSSHVLSLPLLSPNSPFLIFQHSFLPLEMLSSLKNNNSSKHDREDEQDPPNLHHHLLYHHQNLNPRHGMVISRSNTTAQIHQLLIRCAEFIHQHDFSAARRFLSLLSTTTSPLGDSTDRLVNQFARALTLRLNHLSLSLSFTPLPPPLPPDSDADTLQSSYISLNQVTPFLRFSHLTANQAILEAVDQHQSIHILDFDTMYGVQWPPLMQAISERSDPNHPPSIRITGTGTDIDVLRRTGERLKTFADTLGIKFQFHPLLFPLSNRPFPLPNTSTNSSTTSTSDCSMIDLSPSTFQLHPGETLAVNCVMFLHKLLKDDDEDGSCELKSFLRSMKTMNPVVVTVTEIEAYHNSPRFLQRFMEAIGFYTSIFESLEETLPPNSRERLVVEQGWFGREIGDIVAGEGRCREERHERFDQWEHLMKSSGFVNVPLSPFALSQAKLILRLHYPSEGYQLQMIKDSLFLGWKNRPLFSVSSWH